ncbi:uncharacterized protein LOC132310311 [Cornus florida]|uniref:uncharacterized protein LOC132310311 n=1 Tax=Cornus florida TaxID=4283 RepID=UPI002898BDAB|nr:uncharacterized protein LOC132310311 [Cornus florida]
MVRTLEDMRGVEGSSVRVGATGTVSTLMTRELDSMKCTSQKTSLSCKRKPPTAPVSVSCGVCSIKRSQATRISSNNATTKGSMSHTNHTRPGSSSTQRRRCNARRAVHRFPLLGSSDNSLGTTPERGKPGKRGSHIVEIVDLDCGIFNRARYRPITNKL